MSEITNPLLKQLSPVEKKIFEFWKELWPVGAYQAGLSNYAGKMLVPTEENIERLKKKLTELKKEAEDEIQMKFLESLEQSINFRYHEPYMIPSTATNAFFYHMVKEGIQRDHMMSLVDLIRKSLIVAKERFAAREWPVEIKILTCMKSNGLKGILEVMSGETDDSELKGAFNSLKEEVESYASNFLVEGIKEGDFTEIFPILEEKGGDIGHKAIYPSILTKEFDYPESPEEVEKKALGWLKRELPALKEVVSKLSVIHNCEATPEAVAKALTKNRNVPKSKVLDWILKMREKARKVFDKNIVKITPKYDTRIIETPSYLVPFIPTAAMNTFDSLTDKPFNIFFVTTDEKRSPPSSSVDLMQSLLHEEYGHCVNFSNSATGFGAKPKLVELLDSYLHYQISDAISFYREFEFVKMLKNMTKRKLAPEEKDFLDALGAGVDLETVVLENEFVMLEWRFIRFLRAVFDSRVNMGKQTITEFLEWAEKETGLNKKAIYDQTFFFLAYVGYAPVYSIGGESLRHLQELAIENGKSALDFNTYASAMGFPGRTIFEKRLKDFATAK
ncbi:MAG: hypothetical protein ACFE7E_07195 [Candidatus Hodarchaeota archaeon]